MKSRKIVQVHTIFGSLFALCDDGTLWEQDLARGKVDYMEDGVKKSKYVAPWIQLENVPDDPNPVVKTPDPSKGRPLREGNRKCTR